MKFFKKTEEETTPEFKGRTMQGRVVSTSMKDTIAVVVERFVKHPKYKKFQKRNKKYLVHDEGNTAQDGDRVSITEVKPISKKKRFTLVK